MLSTIKNSFAQIIRDEEGASLVEYVLMVALIAVVKRPFALELAREEVWGECDPHPLERGDARPGR